MLDRRLTMKPYTDITIRLQRALEDVLYFGVSFLTAAQHHDIRFGTFLEHAVRKLSLHDLAETGYHAWAVAFELAIVSADSPDAKFKETVAKTLRPFHPTVREKIQGHLDELLPIKKSIREYYVSPKILRQYIREKEKAERANQRGIAALSKVIAKEKKEKERQERTHQRKTEREAYLRQRIQEHERDLQERQARTAQREQLRSLAIRRSRLQSHRLRLADLSRRLDAVDLPSIYELPGCDAPDAPDHHRNPNVIRPCFLREVDFVPAVFDDDDFALDQILESAAEHTGMSRSDIQRNLVQTPFSDTPVVVTNSMIWAHVHYLRRIKKEAQIASPDDEIV